MRCATIASFPILLVLLFAGCGGSGNSKEMPTSPATAQQLTGQVWNLVLAQNPTRFTVLSPAENSRRPTLSFEEDRARLFTGCNSGSGPITFKGRNGGSGTKAVVAELGPIGITRKACHGNAGKIERMMINVMSGAVLMGRDGDSLEVFQFGPEATSEAQLQFLADSAQ